MKSCLLFLWMTVCVAVAAANERPARPNVILIVGESHRAEALGVAGNTFVKTPYLDALAARSVRFSHAYVTTAICSVSRASILSGQHRARHGINDFSSDFSDDALQQTLPIVLKNTGYALGWVGFFGVGKNPPGEYFDLWEPRIPWQDANGVHHTDAVARTAIEWLESYKEAKPFFLQLNFNAAHEIDPTPEQPAHYLVPDRFRELYANIDIPVPQTADARTWESFPDFFRTDQNIARQRWHGFFSSDDLFQRNAKDYYRLITGVDEAVGSVIRKLEMLGLAENTIVIYTSDHGFSLGEHGMMGKWYPFDNSMHVPLLIHDPRQTELAGTEADAMALNIDLAPTILGLVDVPAPAAMQGVNLMQVLTGRLPRRAQFFYEHTVFSSPLLPKVEAVITKRLRYVKYIEHDYEALYDFEKDPDESRNLVHDPAYANDLAAMRKLYKEERIRVQHPHSQ